METTQDTFKETEFDSSVSTLRRIDILIMEMHRCSVMPDLKAKLKFIDLLDCLFVEGQSKFTKDELSECIKFQEGIEGLRKRWGNNLYKNSNKNYYLGWQEVWSQVKKYQIHVMRCLDKHNMLMRDVKDGLSKFRGM